MYRRTQSKLKLTSIIHEIREHVGKHGPERLGVDQIFEGLLVDLVEGELLPRDYQHTSVS